MTEFQIKSNVVQLIVPSSRVVLNEVGEDSIQVNDCPSISIGSDTTELIMESKRVRVEDGTAKVEVSGSGPQGPAGASAGTAVIHNQTTAATVWSITHGLGRPVSVQVFNSSGCEVVVEVILVDGNTLEVRSLVAFTGTAIIL